MSKYQPLSERLAGHSGDQWRASFAEIESVLGFPLPKAARAGRSWWSGAERPHTRAWLTSGWEVGDVDHMGGFITFRRPVSEAAMQTPPPEPAHEVQPLAMRLAAEGASIAPRARRWGLAAAVAAVAAVTAGAAVALGMARRRGQAESRA